MKIRLNFIREIEVKKSINEIAGILDVRNTKFNIIRHNLINYEATSKISIGTLSFKGFNNFLPIKINIKLRNKDNDTTIVQFYTYPRVELVLITIILVVLVILQLLGKGIPIVVTTVILPLSLIWFGWLYRSQETALQSKVENFIKNH